ncbi:hypothetical protein F5878DRAFT_611743 [Lentinula raphanica]|uniref:Calcium uniporter protein, mitochondrial n=1 Tax=Lentinula raphanica TaxID=153919 RepID=A0AA38PDF8_9AGAR|nr:hypothetical protein F5880DRAFT_1595077 [Lentinula raphanica]KAJ3840894.1 hypothetical protein F5878DRAFT_611743 [Lentinula raphanica]
MRAGDVQTSWYFSQTMVWTRILSCSTLICSSKLHLIRCSVLTPTAHAFKLQPAFRFINTASTRPISNGSLENSKVEHSQFLSDATTHSKWRDTMPGNGTSDNEDDELSGIEEGVGKLLPTSSHLFKLILPLGRKGPNDSVVPTVLLLHPSQPLSHTSRLILASLPPRKETITTISFRCTPSSSSPQNHRQFEWSDSTDIGDFIRDAARAAEFSIHIIPESNTGEGIKGEEQIISVRVPTFADRTRFLRRRLNAINHQLTTMEGLKRECDREARKGARRMALGGFGMLVVYWAAVARLTFWDYGWDVMEPITYLSGLSTVICGYLWFLYQGREVSYSSVLDRSVSSRREALYKQRGLDIEKWMELVSEKRHLMREIGQIKEDYEQPQGEKGRRKKDLDRDEDEKKDIEGNKNPLQDPEDEKERAPRNP